MSTRLTPNHSDLSNEFLLEKFSGIHRLRFDKGKIDWSDGEVGCDFLCIDRSRSGVLSFQW